MKVAQTFNYLVSASAGDYYLESNPSYDLQVNLLPCECEQYAFGEVQNVTKIVGDEADSDVLIEMPLCVEEKLPEGCFVEKAWTYSVTLADGSEVPEDVGEMRTGLFRVKGLSTAQRITSPVSYDLEARADNGSGSYQDVQPFALLKFTVTHAPCYCADYELTDLPELIYEQGSGVLEAFFDIPYCRSGSGVCVSAENWNITAFLQDGSELPDSIVYDQTLRKFTVEP